MSGPLDSFFRVLKPRRRTVKLCSSIDNAASELYYWRVTINYPRPDENKV
jgi:hypothetical protein